MNRVYTKNELLSCATDLLAGEGIDSISWALNNISAMAEDNIKMLLRWTSYFHKKGIKPSYKISAEAEKEAIKLFNQYKVEQASFHRYEETRSIRAAQLVAMMEQMRQAQA